METKFKKPGFMDILAIVVILLSFSYFFSVYYSRNVSSDSNFTTQIVTAVIAMDMLILSYYFGNSKSSANKDATILQQAQTANTIPTTVKAETVNADNVEVVNSTNTNVANQNEKG